MKPMGWVVDMRHYLDEETGDLPDRLPTPVLNLALFFGSVVAWSLTTCRRAIGTPTSPAGGVPVADAARATSWPNWIAPQDTSCGNVPCAATTA